MPARASARCLRAACARGIARGIARVNGLPGFALAPYVRIGPFEGPRTKEANMSIGLGIFLFVVGAILTFALNVQTDWIDLDLVGYLLMGAGIVVTIIGIALLVRRRQSITTVRSDVDPATGTRVDQRATETDPLP
jgi:hypothetical protein